MTAPVEREFVVYRRGEARELILATWREALRGKVDPDTGVLFTEDTIRLVTQPDSRFFAEADGIDLCLMGGGKRAEFLSQQISHDRASSAFLRGRHAPTWGETYLPGFSSTGAVAATGTPGTAWVGSTTLPDPAATFGVDPAGNRYQVYVSGAANANGEATLQVASLDLGLETNIEVGTVIRWSNAPGGSAPTAVVTGDDLTGGQPPENDQDFVDRLGSRIRHKPAAGNAAQFRAWAREASVSVEDAFVYPTALHAGSVVVALAQKRGSTSGPNARIAGALVLASVTGRLAPPGSDVVPDRVRVLVLAPQARSSNAVLLLSLLKGTSSGWADVEPFPTSRGALSSVVITTLTTQQNFQITSGAAGQLPGGVTGPLAGVSLMVWNTATSRFVELSVLSVEDLGSGVYRVLLNSAPSFTLATGTFISPDTARRIAIAEGVEEYFDSLGPGEVVTLATDARGATAFRRPRPAEEYPQRAGQAVVTFVSDALQSAAADIQLDVISVATPSVPANPASGPELLVIGGLNVLPL